MPEHLQERNLQRGTWFLEVLGEIIGLDELVDSFRQIYGSVNVSIVMVEFSRMMAPELDLYVSALDSKKGSYSFQCTVAPK
jgi:hypothetical protein